MNIILIYGNTCSGKSTLGKELEKKSLGKYLSFGDLKRKEISFQSNLGKTIPSQLFNN